MHCWTQRLIVQIKVVLLTAQLLGRRVYRLVIFKGTDWLTNFKNPYIHLQGSTCVMGSPVVEYLKVRFPAAVIICKTYIRQAWMLCKTVGQQALTSAQRGWKV